MCGIFKKLMKKVKYMQVNCRQFIKPIQNVQRLESIAGILHLLLTFIRFYLIYKSVESNCVKFQFDDK